MIEVERYSIDAFKPQKQTHHLKKIMLHLDENKFQSLILDTVPKHLQHEILKLHEQYKLFYQENLDDLQLGVWVFISGYKNNQSLNHLARKVPCYKALLPDDIDVYDCNLQNKLRLSDDECKIFGCYIPARSLVGIQNIHRCTK